MINQVKGKLPESVVTVAALELVDVLHALLVVDLHLGDANVSLGDNISL